ncbi:MAG TPA: TlpA disulfide reductase family protein [Gemmataceae bacterium]
MEDSEVQFHLDDSEHEMKTKRVRNDVKANRKDKGLVVIGVHSADQSDKLNDFLKEKKITFPVMIDQGDTAQRYAIEGWPTYFLIEKTGTVVWGFAHNPPSTAQIEELLKK